MPRILAIDYGTKRVGVAVTDPLQMIATPLTAIHAKDIVAYIIEYISKEEVEAVVVGLPKDMMNNDSDSEKHIQVFIRTLKNKLPELNIIRYDERFTSKMAQQTMLEAGLKKKARQNKQLIDQTSAVIILQSYLEHKKFQHH